jgi:hypothetical protein
MDVVFSQPVLLPKAKLLVGYLKKTLLLFASLELVAAVGG